jgi:hypothetical protein
MPMIASSAGVAVGGFMAKTIPSSPKKAGLMNGVA